MFPDYAFDSKYFEIDGNRLHYIDEGAGPVVILVHGNPTWSYYYRHLIVALREDFRVLALDHIGCGLSDKPNDYRYTLEKHINNLENFLEHLGLDSFSLVLHDWGGAIGLGAVVGRTEKIENIVVLNTAAFRSSQIPLRIRICKIPIFGEVVVRLLNGFAFPATFMAVSKRMPREVARAYIAPYDTWKNRIATHRFVKDIPLKPSHPSYQKLVEIEGSLEKIRQSSVPMQIVWGGRDFCFNDHFYNEWRQRFPEAETHYFPGGGHYILEDEKDRAIPLIRNFLLR